MLAWLKRLFTPRIYPLFPGATLLRAMLADNQPELWQRVCSLPAGEACRAIAADLGIAQPGPSWREFVEQVGDVLNVDARDYLSGKESA